MDEKKENQDAVDNTVGEQHPETTEEVKSDPDNNDGGLGAASQPLPASVDKDKTAEANQNQDGTKPVSSSRGQNIARRIERGIRPVQVIMEPPFQDVLVMEPAKGMFVGLSDGVPAPCGYKHKVGRLYVYKYKVDPESQKATPTCVLGPCWPMNIVVTALIAGIPVAVIVLLGSKDSGLLLVTPVFVLAVSITLFFYYRTAFGDPGLQRITDAIPENAKNKDLWYFDDRIGSYRSPKWHYDQETRLIIEDIDHFCPWTGTIIAKKNMVPFICFNGWLWVLCAVTILSPILFIVILGY